MGRHRNDPRGVGQVMAIVVAVVLLVCMIGLGVFFFYRSLPSTSSAGVSANAAEASVQEEQPDDLGALYIRVVGESSNVHVRVPGGDVLLDYELKQGQSVNYTSAEDGLEVTVEDPGAVEVFVHGEEHDVSAHDQGHSFTVDG